MTNALGFKDIEKKVSPFLNETPFIVIRLDGKGFSRFTRPLRTETPFSPLFTEAMKETTRYLVENIQNVVMGYTQSDEISLVLYRGDAETSEHWYDGKLEKIVSVSAGMASAKFATFADWHDVPVFDARAFNLDKGDISSYMVSRRESGRTNAIGMLSRSMFSHSSLTGMSTRERVRRLEEVGMHVDESIPAENLHGIVFRKIQREEEVTYTHSQTGETHTITAMRNKWVDFPAQDEDFAL